MKNKKEINDNDGVHYSGGVSNSSGISDSYGVSDSEGVSDSYGINNGSGINNSYGISDSSGINNSSGISDSSGINNSSGISDSYGIINSYGVDRHIFCADKKRSYHVFSTEVSRERFMNIWSDLIKNLDGWKPLFNNAYILLKKAGEWKKVDASNITSTLDDYNKPYEAWKDMPRKAIDYLVSLPEFDAKIFKRVTGIDVERRNHKFQNYKFCPNCGEKLKK